MGVTNNEWYKGKTKQPLKYSDWPADAPAKDTSGWVHSVAVVHGHVCDFQARQPISALWLEKNNQPDPHRGYMRTIRKVWRLDRCTRPGAGCKGACRSASAVGRRRCGGGSEESRTPRSPLAPSSFYSL